MADNEDEIPEEEQQKKKEPPKPVTWKIFLNDMNSWFSSFFIENMRTDNKPDALNKYDFMGTTQNTKKPLPSLFTPKEIKINYNYNYESPVFENDIFVYNLDGANFNEIDYIIKGLKALNYEKEKVLIIITSIMTWARTPPKYKKEEGEGEQENEGEGENEEKKEEEPQAEEGEKEPESEEEEYVVEEGEEENKEDEEKKEEEPQAEEGEKQEPKKILLYKEKDFIKRVPSRKFYHNKMVETVALANTNPKLKTYIVCAGHIYGCGEDLFYDYFKMSWLQSPEKLPLIGKGKNVVPTIHIKDLVSLIRRVIETRPKNKYIFAIDHTKNRTLKNIITSISKGVGTGLIQNYDEHDKDKIPHYEELVIDVKAKPTKLFLDEKKDDEEEEEFEKRTFKWHCEFGIPENIEKLRQEFNEYRGMKNVKIFISGPPGSGKSYIAEKISKFYNIPHYTIKDFIDYGKKLTDELGEEIKTKLEEIDNAVKEEEENYKKRPNRKITDLPLDLSQKVKLPDETVVKLLKRKLAMNVCKNRGYILDGYPKGYTNAHNVFFEDTDESKTPDDPTKYNLLKDILPNGFIRIDGCNENLILNRLKKLPDINGDPNIIERRFKRRWKAYKELNESEKGEPNLDNFFAENKVDILRVNGTLDEGKVLEKCKVFIERNGKIKNYQVFDEEFEVIEKQKVQEKIRERNFKHDEEEVENEFYDNEKDEVKKQYNEKKKTDLAIEEKKLLEEKSEILRKYLSENVIPVLSKGILHVCKELPEDPVDELAQFLFNNSHNAKFPPQKYYPQQDS